jgi:hypothetical protein
LKGKDKERNRAQSKVAGRRTPLLENDYSMESPRLGEKNNGRRRNMN